MLIGVKDQTNDLNDINVLSITFVSGFETFAESNLMVDSSVGNHEVIEMSARQKLCFVFGKLSTKRTEWHAICIVKVKLKPSQGVITD